MSNISQSDSRIHDRLRVNLIYEISVILQSNIIPLNYIKKSLNQINIFNHVNLLFSIDS